MTIFTNAVIIFVMDKCFVIANVNSGNYVNYTDEELKDILGVEYEFVRVDIDDDFLSMAKAEKECALAVVGGDGTLNSILNKIKRYPFKVYYIPKGTLNEKAKGNKRFNSANNTYIGKANGQIFTYVAAAGSFTPIGYRTKTKTKKRLKLFAYFVQALKEYKVYDIPTELKIDGVDRSGNYTLIMYLKSPRCFIFRFNKLYSPDTEEGHLLLISSPGKDNFINRVRIFFPLFRAFFIGFRKEVKKKNLVFTSFKTVDMKLNSETSFAFDGEKKTLNGDIRVKMTPLRPDLIICSPKNAKR